MRWSQGTALVTGFGLLIGSLACGPSGRGRPEFNKANDPVAIKKLMTPATRGTRQDGIALSILLDTSGSMNDPVPGADGRPAPKIQIAQKALLNFIGQLASFIRGNPDKRMLVGIYDFSSRKDQPSCRQVVKLGAPDVTTAQAAVAKLVPAGTTPIGDAMIVAQRDLDATGFSHRHILVITDGENTVGYLPGDVARVILQEPADDRSDIYFIAFDVGAEVFDPVKNAGGLVLAADSERQLTDAIDSILSGKILAQPESPPSSPHPIFGAKK